MRKAFQLMLVFSAVLIVIAGCGQKLLFEENFGSGSDKNWIVSDPDNVKFENNRFVINPGSKDKPTLTKRVLAVIIQLKLIP